MKTAAEIQRDEIVAEMRDQLTVAMLEVAAIATRPDATSFTGGRALRATTALQRVKAGLRVLSLMPVAEPPKTANDHLGATEMDAVSKEQS